jgi:cob(I)alamin adenosyltransferase
MTIRITRVYTRGGDKGQTSLVGGGRVDKDHPKLEACGDVDELNCLTGAARTEIAAKDSGLSKAARAEFETMLQWIQNRLFDVGSLLATPAGVTYPNMPEIVDADMTRLEKDMDRMQADLAPLKSFCLPGGTRANAALHQCRAVCRRAERQIIRLAREEDVDARLRKYVNRLSDWFFTAARYASKQAKAPEYLWVYGEAAAGRKGKGRG